MRVQVSAEVDDLAYQTIDNVQLSLVWKVRRNWGDFSGFGRRALLPAARARPTGLHRRSLGRSSASALPGTTRAADPPAIPIASVRSSDWRNSPVRGPQRRVRMPARTRPGPLGELVALDGRPPKRSSNRSAHLPPPSHDGISADYPRAHSTNTNRTRDHRSRSSGARRSR